MIRMDGVLGGYIVECNLCGMTTGVAFSTDEAAMEHADDEGWSASEDGSETWCPDCVRVGESGESKKPGEGGFFRFRCFYCRKHIEIWGLEIEDAITTVMELKWEFDTTRSGVVCPSCCMGLQVISIAEKANDPKRCSRCGHNPATDHLRMREEMERLQERFDKMAERVQEVEGELRAVDAVLERRAALDGMVSREVKVGKAISVAKLADKAILLKRSVSCRRTLAKENADYKSHLANALRQAKAVCQACDYWADRADNTETVLDAWQEHVDTAPHDGCECEYCKGRLEVKQLREALEPFARFGRVHMLLLLPEDDIIDVRLDYRAGGETCFTKASLPVRVFRDAKELLDKKG